MQAKTVPLGFFLQVETFSKLNSGLRVIKMLNIKGRGQKMEVINH